MKTEIDRKFAAIRTCASCHRSVVMRRISALHLRRLDAPVSISCAIRLFTRLPVSRRSQGLGLLIDVITDVAWSKRGTIRSNGYSV
jgi:hypothetical protein